MEGELEMVRCIDTTNGKERFMPASLIKDKKLLAQYNLKVQDLAVNAKEVQELAKVDDGIDTKEEDETAKETVKKVASKGKVNKKVDDGIDE